MTVDGGSASSGATVRVRPATVADADGIAGVHVRSWQAAYRGLLPQAFLDGLDPARRADVWLRWLVEDGPSLATLVAEDGTDVVGFVNVCATRDGAEATADDRDGADGDGAGGRVGEVTSIYVLPGRWRAGVGRALLDAAVTLLADAGFTEATLWVLEGNDRARRFYETAGWHRDGAARDESIGGAQAREVRYRRPLPPRVDPTG